MSAAAGGGGRVPRVSVVMAVRDGERYVAEGIGSLLAQSHDDFELVVVDDGSTDRTGKIVRSIADSRIRLVENARALGLAASLNRGLAVARGELVARQDVDDRSAPGRLARQVAYLDAHPEVALVGSWYREVDAGGAPIGECELPVEHEDVLWALHFYSPLVHSAALWRRVPVRDIVGHYDERLAYSMDYDLWWRIAARFRVANVPEVLVDLRVHEGSMTATYGARADEGRRMRAARISRALGWADPDTEDGMAASLARFDRLYSLMHGPVRARSARDLRRDVGDLLRLHALFCRERGIVEGVARGQRRAMARTLGSRLRRGARLCAAEGRLLDAVAHRARAMAADAMVRRSAAVERAGRGEARG